MIMVIDEVRQPRKYTASGKDHLQFLDALQI